MSAELIAQYEEHLVLVRNLAENSIRGYVSDLESFLKHLEKLHIEEFSQLELTHIRSWLAELQGAGVARSTMARGERFCRASPWGVKQGLSPTVTRSATTLGSRASPPFEPSPVRARWPSPR